MDFRSESGDGLLDWVLRPVEVRKTWPCMLLTWPFVVAVATLLNIPNKNIVDVHIFVAVSCFGNWSYYCFDNWNLLLLCLICIPNWCWEAMQLLVRGIRFAKKDENVFETKVWLRSFLQISSASMTTIQPTTLSVLQVVSINGLEVQILTGMNYKQVVVFTSFGIHVVWYPDSCPWK